MRLCILVCLFVVQQRFYHFVDAEYYDITKDVLMTGRNGTYVDAHKYCKSHGYNLNRVKDSDEQNFIYRLAEFYQVGLYWIDANDIAKKGTWVNSNNETLTYIPWSTNKSDNIAGDEHCIEGSLPPNKLLNYANCSLQKSIICYRDIVPVTKDVINTGQSGTYADAQEYCQFRGNKLIDIYNDVENLLVYEAAKYSNVGLYWIDGNDIAKKGRWVNSDNENLTFTPWETNKPDNIGGDEHCIEGYLPPGRLWNDANCTLQKFIICYDKHTPQPPIPIPIPQTTPKPKKYDATQIDIKMKVSDGNMSSKEQDVTTPQYRRLKENLVKSLTKTFIDASFTNVVIHIDSIQPGSIHVIYTLEYSTSDISGNDTVKWGKIVAALRRKYPNWDIIQLGTFIVINDRDETGALIAAGTICGAVLIGLLVYMILQQIKLKRRSTDVSSMENRLGKNLDRARQYRQPSIKTKLQYKPPLVKNLKGQNILTFSENTSDKVGIIALTPTSRGTEEDEDDEIKEQNINDIHISEMF